MDSLGHVAAAGCYAVGLATDVEAWWKARLVERLLAWHMLTCQARIHTHAYAVPPHLIVHFRLIYLGIIIIITIGIIN